jgi:HEAT repeat protein
LLKQLKDNDPGARIAAAGAYWSVTGKSADPVRVLRDVLRVSDGWTTQMWAANELANIGPEASAAVDELIACLGSETEHVVTSAAGALGRIGPNAKAALPTLIVRLESSDDAHTRACVARALWQIDRWESSPGILQDLLAEGSNSMALSEGSKALGEMGAAAKAAVPLLRPLLMHGDSYVREAAAKALRQIEGE